MLLAATGLLGACSSDEEARVTGEPVPIWLSAAVEGSQTRAATTSTTGDEVLLDGQDVDAYIKVKGGDWVTTGLSATVPRHFSVTGNSGDLTRKSGEDMDYYPMDGTPVSIYAVHPSIASAATFTVQSDQTDDANYAASDLSYSKTADYNRSESPQTLTFGHVLSKIIVNVQTDLGTVNSVKLRAKKSTTLTYPANNDDGYTLGTASGVGMIEMNAGGAAIIPPQTTAAVGDVRIIVEIDGKGTFVYNFPASTTFASNTEYTYTVKIGASITVTSSISAWGYNAAGTLVNADDINNKTVQIGRPKLPIEYVGEHNMATGTTMASDDKAISSGFFMWGTNKDTKTATFTKFFNGTALSGYHLPTQPEWAAILPAMCSFKSGKSTNNSENVRWGVTNNNGTYTFDVDRTYYCDYNFPNDEAHAYIGYGLKLRELTGGNYVNGIYTCAYRYEYKVKQNDQDGPSLEIRVKYVGKNATISIDAISDENYWGATQDFLCVIPACGHTSNVEYASGSTYSGSTAAWYWTYSGYDTNRGRDIYFNVDKIQADSYDGTTTSASVRLFKDVGTP